MTKRSPGDASNLPWFERGSYFFAPFLLLSSHFGMGVFEAPRSPAMAGRGMRSLMRFK